VTLIPEDFARTGITSQGPVAPVQRFQVLGERSSGTNFVKRLLGRNTRLEPTEALGWKHACVAPQAIPADLAVICVVRAPEPWALSMHDKPWHTTPEMQRLPFAEFIRHPWETVIDRARYFDLPNVSLGQPLQADRDPETGLPHQNLFALRRAKLAGLLGFLSRDCTCVLLRLETVQAAPEQMLESIAKRLELPVRDAPFRPVFKRLGAKFKAAVSDRPDRPDRFPDTDRSFMTSQLDTATEAALGYLAR
jgi:hypothetical protein